MVHDLTLAILGELPIYSYWVYSVFDFLLVIVTILVLISPFVIVIKLLGGK